MGKRLHVIINPASGRARPILRTLNNVFHPAGVSWSVSVTNQAGDARRFAREAVETGVDIVAVYGGDGTVMEVASGLLGSDVPLAIFPGGTANVMSVELGITSDLAEACALVCHEDNEVVVIDIGQSGQEEYFILRVGIGLEAKMVEGADPELKSRVGSLAYALAALNALRHPVPSRYQMKIDGQEVESAGLTCLLCNSGSLGRAPFKLSPHISVRDGLLDVVVLRKADLASILNVARDIVEGKEPTWHALQHWQGKEVTVVAEPNQDVQLDGEPRGQTPVSARVLPQAVKVIVPKGASVLQAPMGLRK